MNGERFHDLRQEYEIGTLDVDDVAADPITQFDRWLGQAIAAGVDEPNAMVLSTVDQTGRPSSRVVLLKGFDDRGFVFFTNYESRKALDLAVNSSVSLCFLWQSLHRQVIVQGSAERTAGDESDEYFAARPREARIGAHASPQSRVIPDRVWLEGRVVAVVSAFAEADVPRPFFWGGFRVRPDSVEFWQGRPNRLHDRIRYRRMAEDWVVERLAP